ncbi:MAG: ribulose-phosphate 3-epimerase [Clostridia bacterium]|nr:ribulose-phosphate 3-epimerase [Clostridia bacterium]
MRKSLYISPSTDPISPKSKDFEKKIVLYAKELLEAGADFLHCDVMDGEFVKNSTYDYEIVEKINSNCLIPLDVHLMIEDPVNQIDNYRKAGANFITVHYESFENEDELKNVLTVIRQSKLLAGLSIKPKTPIENIEEFLEYCDIVMVMSVNPGMSGKKFIVDCYEKFKKLNKMRKDKKLNFLIQADGGINPIIAQEVKKLGVDIIVSGNFIYNAKDKKEAMESLR